MSSILRAHNFWIVGNAEGYIETLLGKLMKRDATLGLEPKVECLWWDS